MNVRIYCSLICAILGIINAVTAAAKCYDRLEGALDEMLYKTQARSQSRSSFIDVTGYRSHYDFNPSIQSEDGLGTSQSSSSPDGPAREPKTWESESRTSEIEDLLTEYRRGRYQQRLPNRFTNNIQPSSVEVSNIKFRVPRNLKWVISMVHYMEIVFTISYNTVIYSAI